MPEKKFGAFPLSMLSSSMTRSSDQALWNRMLVGLRMPYPLDSETAPAVDAAIEHHVIPWEVLEEGDEVHQWLINHYLAQGQWGGVPSSS